MVHIGRTCLAIDRFRTIHILLIMVSSYLCGDECPRESHHADIVASAISLDDYIVTSLEVEVIHVAVVVLASVLELYLDDLLLLYAVGQIS